MIDSYDSHVEVQKLPKHLSEWEISNQSTNQSTSQQMYWIGMMVGLIGSLCLTLPVSVFDQSINQSINQAVNQSITHSVYNSSVYYPLINQSINQPISQYDVPLALGLAHTMMPTSINQSIYQSITFSNLVIFAVFLLSLYLYHIINRPLVFDRPLSTHERMVALRRSYPDMPPPFPNAWFRLCNDFNLNQPISQTGKQTSDEIYAPYVIHAFDHLFTVQRLIDGSITCVDESGREWEVCEVNRVVFVWHDVNGRASSWQIPAVNFKTAGQPVDQPINQSDSDEWQFVGATSHEIMAHIQEIPENGADTAHLDYLHGSFILDWLTGSVASHTWDASWQPAAHPNSHIANIRISTSIALFGMKLPGSTVNTRITQVGPGIVQLLFPIPHFGNVLLQETITPIHANLQRATHVIYCQNTVPKPIAKLIMKSTLIQFERDFIVWNSKRWIRSPLAVKEDGPILKYRRWMKQFFDEAGGELKRDYDGQSIFISKMKH